MPKKKDVPSQDQTQPTPPSVLGAPPVGAEAGAISSAVTTPKERGQFPIDAMQALTDALGAKHWSYNKQFDWARDATRHHFTFTRFYFQEHVLVDVFPDATASVRSEVVKRGAAVEAENTRRAKDGFSPIGYLPIVRGAIVPSEAFERVRRGEVLELVERARAGVLV